MLICNKEDPPVLEPEINLLVFYEILFTNGEFTRYSASVIIYMTVSFLFLIKYMMKSLENGFKKSTLNVNHST